MKKILSILLSLIIGVCAFSLVACTPPQPQTVDITITISKEGDACVGAVIALNGDYTYDNLTSDEEGKITAAVVPGEYIVVYVEIPEYYSGIEKTLSITESGQYALNIEQTVFFFSSVDAGYDETEKAMTNEVTIPANKTYHYMVMRAQGREIVIYSNNLTAKILGEEITADQGAIRFNLQGTAGDTFTPGEFTLTNITNQDVTVTIYLKDLPESDTPEETE